MEKCPKCNSIVAKGQAFCTFCGERFIEVKQPEPPVRTAPSSPSIQPAKNDTPAPIHPPSPPKQAEQPHRHVQPRISDSPPRTDPPIPPKQTVYSPHHIESLVSESPDQMNYPLPPVQVQQAPPVQSVPAGHVKTCPKCNHKVAEDHNFCEDCGEQLKGGEKRRTPAGSSSPSRRGKYLDKLNRKSLRKSRIAIMIVAILLIVSSLILLALMEVAAGKSGFGTGRRALSGQTLATLQVFAGIAFVIGLVFLGLYFWARKNPFSASMTALVLFLTSTILNLGINPGSLGNKGALIINIAVIIVLARGVKSALFIRNLQEKPEIKT